jgi:tellurite resistance protein TehA-like permease
LVKNVIQLYFKFEPLAIFYNHNKEEKEKIWLVNNLKKTTTTTTITMTILSSKCQVVAVMLSVVFLFWSICIIVGLPDFIFSITRCSLLLSHYSHRQILFGSRI